MSSVVWFLTLFLGLWAFSYVYISVLFVSKTSLQLCVYIMRVSLSHRLLTLLLCLDLKYGLSFFLFLFFLDKTMENYTIIQFSRSSRTKYFIMQWLGVDSIRFCVLHIEICADPTVCLCGLFLLDKIKAHLLFTRSASCASACGSLLPLLRYTLRFIMPV